MNAHITLNLFKFQCIFCVELLLRGLTTKWRTFWSNFTSLLITYSTLVMKSTNNSFLLIVSLRLYLVGKHPVRHETPSADNEAQPIEKFISHLKLHCEIFHWIELHQYGTSLSFHSLQLCHTYNFVWIFLARRPRPLFCTTLCCQHTEILKLTSSLSFICWHRMPSMHYVNLIQIPIEP